MKKLRHTEVRGLQSVSGASCWPPRSQTPHSDGEGGGGSGANSAHPENKGAFGPSCGLGCSGQEAGHCEETAVLGAKPGGDVALGSKGTLFIAHPGPGSCWAGAGPPRGLEVMGARPWTALGPPPGIRLTGLRGVSRPHEHSPRRHCCYSGLEASGPRRR